MSDQHFLSSATETDMFGPLHGGERTMWRGRCGVAEYAFDEAASLPRWTLPESTDVMVTDHRVLYAFTADDGHQVKSGELRWLWPQHLRVQPGSRSRDRGAAATQIQLVCGGADGTYPALVFAGGDLATVEDADGMANVIRQAIARFRVDNADRIGLTIGQTRMLSRLLIGPEFRNHQGGEGQTVSLLGALPVDRPAPVPSPPTDAAPASPAAPPPQTAPLSHDVAAQTVPLQISPNDIPAQLPGESGTRLVNYRPGRAGDAARALMAAKAEEAAHSTEPATASRAADLAARVANLVTQFAELETPAAREQDRSVAGPPAHERDRSPAAPAREPGWSPADLAREQHWSSAAPDPQQDWPPPDSTGQQHWPPTGSAGRQDWPPTGPDPQQHWPPADTNPQQTSSPEVPAADGRDGTNPAAYSGPRHAEPKATDTDRIGSRTANLAARAEAIRRTAARMVANSANFRAGSRRADREPGVPKGHRNT